MDMKMYNETLECYNSGMNKCKRIAEEQTYIVMKSRKYADIAIELAVDEFTSCVEAKVKDWSSDDYDRFIGIAEHDERIDNRCILVISTAYAYTHNGDKMRIHNRTCDKAMAEVIADSFSTVLDALDSM